MTAQALYLIDVIRASNDLDDAAVANYVAAIQQAADNHFTPAWGIALDLRFIPPSHDTRGCAQVWIKDRSDQAGDLGYHTDDGHPMAYVFALDDQENDSDVCVTLSHEIWEMAVDPTCQAVMTWVDGDTVYEVGKEVADACEDDSLAFLIDGCKISAFVTPEYFEVGSAGPWSYPPQAVSGPFTIAAGGYLPIREVAPMAGLWTQRMAEQFCARQRKGPASRTMRRFNGDLAPLAAVTTSDG